MSDKRSRKGQNSNKETESVVNMLTNPLNNLQDQSNQEANDGTTGGSKTQQGSQSDQTQVNDPGTNISNPGSTSNVPPEVLTKIYNFKFIYFMKLKVTELPNIQSINKNNEDILMNPVLTDNSKSDNSPDVEKSKGSKDNTVKPIDKVSIKQNYLEILGSKPIGNNQVSITIDDEYEFDGSVDLSDKDKVFDKAMSLAAAGDGIKSTKYLKIYKELNSMNVQMKKPSIIRSNSTIPVNENDRFLKIDRPIIKRTSTENPVVITDEADENHEGVYECGMWVFRGKTTDSTNMSYTPYFDKNIKELRYPIPLTIFSKEWQNSAISHHVRKKVKSDDKLESYTGLPYPDELLQSYGEWSFHYIGFVAALRAVGMIQFPMWAEAHKRNVERIVSKYGWMTALKYNITIRSNAFINRVVVGGKVAPPDIPGYNAFLVEECFDEARVRGELCGLENPYRKGGEREGWDAANGKPPEKKIFDKQFQNKAKFNQALTNASGSGEAKAKNKFKPGYQGNPNNFDPNYAEKKAAANAAKTAANKK
ncbi:uncharacterized protein MELLADRAFT_111149 [Melampsora larici-populina 98AG31]|uniref:Uncharacterized protein n=1 Tax=Melampsora larici-populina (strain 98AG31 / pathotype 3-4-7) TaxID=747676 RepID=F4S268_MELLP|nr:uncharacterized protein MELLADRAFT_111149 [Melampsora larici-populina 98AG31]EGG01308.1 hypothetical protein MELLADRAFT_111149 [Melampsora larici-populina 98AG31]